MEILEIPCTVGKSGCLKIPADIIRQMGLDPGDHIRVAYLTDQSQKNIFREFLLTADPLKQAEDSRRITVPEELMEQAGIPMNTDIQVICAPGAIIITQDPMLDIEGMKKVLESMDIASEILEQLPEDAEDAIYALQEFVSDAQGGVEFEGTEPGR